MLKNLTSKHNEIIRRLVVGQTPKEISAELNFSATRISALQRNDPLFKSAIVALEQSVNRRIEDSMERLSVLKTLEEAAFDAAEYCHSVIKGEERDVSPDLRVKSAWDVLNRTGHTPVEKKIVGVLNAADMIIAAYKAKHGEQSLDESSKTIDI